LANGTALKTQEGKEGLEISLPEKAPDAVASVIKVELKGTVDSNTTANGKIKSGSID
jgi:alpha-L-fucosidase